MPLRPYQITATTRISEGLSAGINRQLLVAATGTGKTEVVVHLPEILKDKLPGQTMFIVHRDELAQQAIRKFRKRNPNMNVQQEAGAEHCDPVLADCVVASVQTLGRKGTNRLDKFNRETLDKFIVDEAHRSVADSYYNIYNHFGLLQDNDPRLLLGITATPQRGDGSGLGKLYQKIVYTYSLRQAIEDGYLVDVKGIRVDTKTSLDGVSTKAGDYDQKELSDTVNTPERNKLVASAYVQHCGNRHALVFGVDIKHSKDLAEAFRKEGVNAEAVWGADSDRHDKVQRFRDGKIQVLCNCQLLVEGFDLDTISCVVLASPTKSGVIFSQRIGRGTRIPDGTDNLHDIPSNVICKRDVIVLDVVDSSSRHSLVTLPTLLGLPSGINLRGKSLVGSAKLIEDKLKELPHLDFSTLADIDKIEAFVQEVNLFEVQFPKEVENNSDFTWHPAFGGGYLLMLPNKESVHIEQNLLDKFEVKAYIKGKKYRGERDTMEAAFSAADDLVRKIAPESLKIVNRKEAWHEFPPTEDQIKLLRKLYKGKQIPNDLTRGEASKHIGAALAGRKINGRIK